ncbi:hypothetical protein ABTD12_20360, partial [Acinetobacter baumannii]
VTLPGLGDAYTIIDAERDFLPQLLLINAWPLLGNGVHWDYPAWSISVEMLCYVAVFPLLHRLRGHLPAGRTAFLVLLLSFTSFAV